MLTCQNLKPILRYPLLNIVYKGKEPLNDAIKPINSFIMEIIDGNDYSHNDFIDGKQFTRDFDGLVEAVRKSYNNVVFI